MTDPAKMTVFITGASSGFGEACARRFAAAGSKLILAARRTQRLEQLKAQLPVPTHIISLDVRDSRAVEKTVSDLPAEFADVDVLINNAGLALGIEPAYDADMENWEVMVDTNVKGLLYCTRAVLPRMVERDRGHIINIGSVAGTYPYKGGNVYGATKAFVRQFSLNLRVDLLGTRVRVTDVEPGLAKTEFTLVRLKGDVRKAEELYKGTKPIVPEDMGEIVFWISTLPEHLNINRIEIMPVCQAVDSFAIHRETA
jgi:3-hydroxy acid dehydrogenase/malonic semialdehyde reductase